MITKKGDTGWYKPWKRRLRKCGLQDRSNVLESTQSIYCKWNWHFSWRTIRISENYEEKGCWQTLQAREWVRLTLMAQTLTPFGSVKFAKLSWILIALGSINSRSAGMNPKGQGVNQALLRSQLHTTWMQGLPHKYPPQQTNETSIPKQGWRRGLLIG